MVGPITNPPISTNDSTHTTESSPSQAQLSDSSATAGIWFLPRSSHSLMPITASGKANSTPSSPELLADKVLSHISVRL